MSERKTFNKVLIIDDDPTSVFLAKTAFEDLNLAKEIFTAHDGSEGLDKLIKNCLDKNMAECPDLILLDINMPIMNGIELIEELNKMGEKELIESKIVILTSSTNPGDLNKVASLGVKKCLAKPLTEDKIIPLIV